MRCDNFTAIGAAKVLPITKPNIECQCKLSNSVKKVRELNKAMKNLLSFTLPKAYRAFLPPAINVDKTIEPQPPPPIASINPPPKPNGATLVILLPLGLMRDILKALLKITIPKIRV